MTATTRPGVLIHYLRYLGANSLALAAGFISFPVMTRLLSNHEFGVLGYYEALLMVGTAVLKLGTQHALLRYYPHDGDAEALARFRSNHVLGPYALSLLLWLACVLVVAVLIQRIPAAEQPVLWVVMLTIPLLIWGSFVEQVMYALERSDITLWFKTSWRWSELAMVLATLWLVERSALGVLGAKLLVLVVACAWLTLWFRRWLRGRVVRPSKTALLTGFAFGIPMMFNELTSLLFGFADRILLRALTGDFTQVGIYTIGYGLALSLTAVVGQTLNQAFTPTAIRLYETDGAAAVVRLKRDMLDLWIIAVAVGTGLLLCVGEDFLLILAGDDKAASAPVFAISAIALVWYSLFEVAQYGLLLQRRATRFMLLTLSATVFNLVLNVPLILRLGVMGAVAATVLSYILLAALQLWQCPRELRYLPPLRRLLAAALYAPAVLLFLRWVDFYGAEGHWPRLLLGSLTVMLPAALLAWFDPRVRESLRGLRAGQGAAAGAPGS